MKIAIENTHHNLLFFLFLGMNSVHFSGSPDYSDWTKRSKFCSRLNHCMELTSPNIFGLNCGNARARYQKHSTEAELGLDQHCFVNFEDIAALDSASFTNSVIEIAFNKHRAVLSFFYFFYFCSVVI